MNKAFYSSQEAPHDLQNDSLSKVNIRNPSHEIDYFQEYLRQTDYNSNEYHPQVIKIENEDLKSNASAKVLPKQVLNVESNPKLRIRPKTVLRKQRTEGASMAKPISKANGKSKAGQN